MGAKLNVVAQKSAGGVVLYGCGVAGVECVLEVEEPLVEPVLEMLSAAGYKVTSRELDVVRAMKREGVREPGIAALLAS